MGEEPMPFCISKPTTFSRGWEQKASFVINDDINLMENVFNLIKK